MASSLDIFIISGQTAQCPDLYGEGTAGALRERVAVIVCESLHCPPDDRRLTWLFHLISLDIAEWFVVIIPIVSCLVITSAAISEPIIQKIIYLFKRLERRRFHHHQSEEVCSDFFV